MEINKPLFSVSVHDSAGSSFSEVELTAEDVEDSCERVDDDSEDGADEMDSLDATEEGASVLLLL